MRISDWSSDVCSSDLPSIELGARLSAYTPGDLNHVFFTTGGSTAVDSALRFIQFYFHFTGRPSKKHIITREYAYHGARLSAYTPGDLNHEFFTTGGSTDRKIVV